MNAQDVNRDCYYATKDELEWLGKWARNHQQAPLTTVVMIGAGPGVMALALMEQAESLTLYVVENDTFQYLDQNAKRTLKPPALHRIWRGLGDSAEYGKRWEGYDIDLLIIDGDHSYEGVKRDMAAWLPHVASGGCVLFHDYPYNLNEVPTGVKQAVEECLPDDFEDVAYIGISRIVRRK